MSSIAGASLRGLKGTFRSLTVPNYRVWAAGALVSNMGTWMQRIAQDWLVLTQLTHNSATAVGIVMALQFAPQLLLLPWSGFAADYFDRRTYLFVTQSALGLLALLQGVLVVCGVIQLWEVYVIALLFGCAAALDLPVRQTFVAELVPDADLSNAVGLNSTSFNAARMVGPAVAGLMIAAVGTGWVFIANAVSFAAMIAALALLHTAQLRPGKRATRGSANLLEGFRYVWRRHDLRAMLLMMFLIGTFGLNFPIFISTMSVRVFHAGARQYGFLTSIMAIGTLSGALLSAARATPSIPYLLAGASGFGIGCALAAVSPNYEAFGLALALIGIAAQTLTTSTNSLVQVSTDPDMRGRVLAILYAIALGGTPLGAPIVARVADVFGPRWALAIGAAAGAGAAGVAAFHLRRSSVRA